MLHYSQATTFIDQPTCSLREAFETLQIGWFKDGSSLSWHVEFAHEPSESHEAEEEQANRCNGRIDLPHHQLLSSECPSLIWIRIKDDTN